MRLRRLIVDGSQNEVFVLKISYQREGRIFLHTWVRIGGQGERGLIRDLATIGEGERGLIKGTERSGWMQTHIEYAHMA